LTDGAEIWWQCSGGVAIGFAQFFFLKKMILKICDFSGIFFSNHNFFFMRAFLEQCLRAEQLCRPGQKNLNPRTNHGKIQISIDGWFWSFLLQ
jgi:hypothetical protein